MNMIHLFLLCVVLVHVVESKRFVDIGCMYQTQGSLGPIGSTFPVVCTMWEDFWNNKPNGIAGMGIFPRMHMVDIGTTVPEAVNATNWLVSMGVVAVVPPAGPYVANIAVILNKHKIGFYVGTISDNSIFFCEEPLAAPCTHADGTRRFEWVLGLGTPADNYMQSCLNEIAVRVPAGLEKSVSIITINRSAHTDVCVTGGIPLAQQNGFKINPVHYIDFNATVENIPQENKEMLAAIQKVEGEQPTVVLFCNKYANDRFPQLLFEANYMPPAVCSFEAASNVNEIIQTVGSNALFVQAPVQWHWEMTGLGYIDLPNRPYGCMFTQTSESLTSPKQFANEYNAIPGAPPLNALTPMALLGLYVIEFGIWNSNSTTSAGIFDAASKVNMPTFAGPVAPDLVFGVNSGKPIGTVQLVPTFVLGLSNVTQANSFLDGIVTGFPTYALALTAPVGGSASSMVYPAPTFDERVYIHQMYARPEERAIIVIIGLSVALILAIAWFLFTHRHLPEIKAASLPFSLFTLLGAVIACLSVLEWPVENDNDTCSSRVMMMSLGFGTFFSPLIAKSRRIANIFRTDKLKVVKIKDKDVFVTTFILMTIILFPALLWSTIFPLVPTIVVPDPLRPSLNYTDCSSENWILAYLTFFAVASLLVLAFYQAFRMRKIESKQFKTAKSIALAVYMFIMLVLMASLAQLGFNQIATTLTEREFLLLGRGIYVIAIDSSTIILFWKSTYGVAFPSDSSLQDSTPNHTQNRTQSQSQRRAPSPTPNDKPCERDVLNDPPHSTKSSLDLASLGIAARTSTSTELNERRSTVSESNGEVHTLSIQVDNVPTSFAVESGSPEPSPIPTTPDVIHTFVSAKELPSDSVVPSGPSLDN